MLNFEKKQREYLSMIENGLHFYLPQEGKGQELLFQAMAYSLENGGKRVRPILTLAFCEACGGDPHAALPFACAVEMIHTYSLIHDDLPCMDDDAMRRGKPSCHIQFGEANALLAGDALLTLAFETVLDLEPALPVAPQRVVKAASVLAHAAGGSGMIGGQVIDLASEGKQIPLDRLKVMDALKTGALIDAAAQMGCVVAGAHEQACRAASLYASCIGLAFQIVDDILDVTGSSELLGKPIGSDAEKEKSTYVSLLGLDAARRLVTELTAKAREILTESFGERAAFLLELTERLATREK
ncbi:MAG TPA: polyprenyl synthetase family protein [Candidatus Fimivicinus intestinavium]|nr:polyprenyl synthetase family protein [Candidatus Fimivicinus intestinavium]